MLILSKRMMLLWKVLIDTNNCDEKSPQAFLLKQHFFGLVHEIAKREALQEPCINAKGNAGIREIMGNMED